MWEGDIFFTSLRLRHIFRAQLSPKRYEAYRSKVLTDAENKKKKKSVKDAVKIQRRAPWRGWKRSIGKLQMSLAGLLSLSRKLVDSTDISGKIQQKWELIIQKLRFRPLPVSHTTLNI